MITPLSTSTDPTATGSTASAAASATAAAATGSTDLGNEQTFLTLLVAQMKNQDPLNPTDSMQFVSQLAQFSELEQVIGIHGDLDTMVKSVSNATSTNQTGTTAPVSNP